MSDAVLAVDSVTVAFGGLLAVDEMSLEVQEGELFGVIGPNGAGKTTLLNAISGVIKISKGSVRLRDTTLSGQRPDKIARLGVARTFQGADFFSEFSVLESLLMGRFNFSNHSLTAAMFRLPAFRRAEKADHAAAMLMLEEFGLAERKDEPLSELSYGTRKVLDVLRALLMEPTILLLDEPTSGTTAADREQLRSLVLDIKKRNIGTILVDHDVKFITDVSDSALAMNFGRKLGVGKPLEVLSRPDVRASYIGLE